MRMLPLLCAAALAACAPVVPPGPPAAPQPWYVARFSEPIPHYYRYSSGLDYPANLVVRNQAEWAELWDRITARHGEPPPPPPVDFGREMLLVAAMGTQPTGGYAITIDQVLETPATIDAHVVRTLPGPRCGATAALTHPVDIVRVPVSLKPVRWTTREQFTVCP